jgi:membrane-associated phospholipid phosphatase
MNFFTKNLLEVGQYGPIILLIITCYFLWNKSNMLFYYVIGFFINSILNIILKGIIQQPRPFEDKTQFNAAIKNGKHFIFKDTGIPFDIFGMPSGHAQSCLYSTGFIFLTLKRRDIFSFYILISLITIYQRIHDNLHNIIQIFVGAAIGILFSYGMYYFANQNTKGLIREKKDDYGPI